MDGGPDLIYYCSCSVEALQVVTDEAENRRLLTPLEKGATPNTTHFLLA